MIARASLDRALLLLSPLIVALFLSLSAYRDGSGRGVLVHPAILVEVDRVQDEAVLAEAEFPLPPVVFPLPLSAAASAARDAASARATGEGLRVADHGAKSHAAHATKGRCANRGTRPARLT